MTVVDGSLYTSDGVPNPIRPWFWTRPENEIDADLATLRSLGPQFLPEPELPEDSIIKAGPGAYVITSHNQILEASRHPEVFSSASGITVLDTPPEFNEFFASMIAMDDPRHARLRRIVSRGFTPRMMRHLESTVTDVAAAIVDSVAEAETVDFVVDVAAALPLKIVCDLMGIPDSHYEFVFDRTNIILGVSDPEFTPADGDITTALLMAGGDLAGLMTEVAADKRGGDGTDLTSQLVNADLGDDELSDADLASFFILLVVAGNETTRNAISWGMKYLTDNPEQRHIWQSDFEAVAPTAVEEIVRLASPVTYMRRTLLTDYTLGGVKMHAGDKVLLNYLAANRDPQVFADPLTFDVRRDPNPHVGFGGPGPHFCLGAHLARREITVMFRELFRRVPSIRASGPPDLLEANFIHGIKHMEATI
ncbi:MAG: cytochrome P450 [Acidimicrobiia bacterium]|nr:cytochrome P450 [Acidimicrobiia bacterium]